jgi:hypothetical protein
MSLVNCRALREDHPMTRDEAAWAEPGAAPPADPYPAPPADPYAAHPRYPGEDVWLPAVPGQARAAVLMAWLERRFPDGGTADERARRGRRRTWVVGVLSGVVVVALAVGMATFGLRDSPPPAGHTPWFSVFLALIVVWAVLGAALVLATRSRPAVSRAERDVLARLTAAEHRDLRADLRSGASLDAEHLDVVAAAWLADRGQILQAPWRVLLGLWLATQWQLNPLTLVALSAALLAGWEVVEGLRDLLAARVWSVTRGGAGRRP